MSGVSSLSENSTKDEGSLVAKDHREADAEKRRLNREVFEVIRQGDVSLLKRLLDAGASIEAKHESATPIYWAVFHGRSACLDLLIERGATLNPYSKLGRTPILCAIKFNRTAFVKRLLQADPSLCGAISAAEHPLVLSASLGRVECMRLLLAHQKYMKAVEEYKHQAFHSASGAGRLESVRELLDAGVHIERPDDHGRTALAIAAEVGQVDVLEFLIDQGVSPWVMGRDGKDILETADPGCRALIERARLMRSVVHDSAYDCACSLGMGI